MHSKQFSVYFDKKYLFKGLKEKIEVLQKACTLCFLLAETDFFVSFFFYEDTHFIVRIQSTEEQIQKGS